VRDVQVAESQAAPGKYPQEELQRFSQAVFEKLGMRAADAAVLAAHLVWADAHGITWLGVRKIPQYAARLRDGGTAADAQPVTVLDLPSVLVVDGRKGWGIVTGHHVMNAIVAKASTSGICMGLVRNTSTAGALGYFAALAAEQRMIGMAITNCPPLQAAPGGTTRLIGNQAFSIASPAGRHPPIVLDMATSAITLARIHSYEQRGEPLPAGVALDRTGNPTVDPASALAGVLLPMAGHRGFGLALMWEIFTGVLSGSTQFFSDVLMPDVAARPQGISMFLLAINPQLVMPYAEFQARVDRVIDEIHAAPTSGDNERLVVPGERSHARATRSKREGIALARATVATLSQFGEELGVHWPRPRAS
jgi:LDH2 family malate/lactate/ureidoglycolate dehydrogenase